MKLKWGKDQRERARQAAVQGIQHYQDKKPASKKTRWGTIAALLIGGLIYIQTGNVQLAKIGGDLAGGAVEHVIEEREDRGRTD